MYIFTNYIVTSTHTLFRNFSEEHLCKECFNSLNMELSRAAHCPYFHGQSNQMGGHIQL
jgi:hypothetical protein